MLALYSIERDLRMAGYGVNDTTHLGCNVLAYNDNRTTTNFNFALQPVLITQGAGNNATTGVGAPLTLSQSSMVIQQMDWLPSSRFRIWPHRQRTLK